MMNYPQNYALLAEEEMKYTTGGTNALVVGCWVMTAVVSLGSIAYNMELTNQLKREASDRYDDSREGRVQLSKDMRKEYFKHPQGWLLAAGYALALGCGFVGGWQEGLQNTLTTAD